MVCMIPEWVKSDWNYFGGAFVIVSISDKVIDVIKDDIDEIPEYICSSDLAVFNPRHFVEAENQFDLYHFVIPKVEVPSFFADKKEIKITKGTILPTNPGQKLRVSPINEKYNKSSDVKFTCLFIKPNKLQEISKAEFNKNEISFYNNLSYLSDNILTLISKFEMEHRNRQFGCKFILECLSTEIVINLIRELKSNVRDISGVRKYSARNEINTAIDYLWENTNMEFSLNNLSSIVNLSPYYFIRLFKDFTGKTPYEYYMDIKISKALECMKTKKYSITEIYFILGFLSHSHFTSIFKKRVGKTPSEYIKSIR